MICKFHLKNDYTTEFLLGMRIFAPDLKLPPLHVFVGEETETTIAFVLTYVHDTHGEGKQVELLPRRIVEGTLAGSLTVTFYNMVTNFIYLLALWETERQ